MGLLAASADAGYWQSPPSPSGAWNGGSAPVCAGSGASSGDASELVDAVLLADAVVSPPGSRLVMTIVATTAPITMTAAAADPIIVYRRRLRSFSARLSSWRSSLRLAAARRCSLVGTAGVLLAFDLVGTECASCF